MTKHGVEFPPDVAVVIPEKVQKNAKAMAYFKRHMREITPEMEKPNPKAEKRRKKAEAAAEKPTARPAREPRTAAVGKE